MTDVDVSDAFTMDGTNVETSSDGSVVTSGLAPGLSDGDTGTEVIKLGKDPEDIMRLDYAEDPANLQVGDTITSFDVGFHNVSELAIYPYDTSTSVDATNKIVSGTGSGTNVFTLTSGFIGALLDQGGGTFAIRLHENAWDISSNPGDIKFTEVEADLTTAAPPTAGPIRGIAINPSVII